MQVTDLSVNLASKQDQLHGGMINKNSSKQMHMNLDLRACEAPDEMRRLEAALAAAGNVEVGVGTTLVPSFTQSQRSKEAFSNASPVSERMNPKVYELN